MTMLAQDIDSTHSRHSPWRILLLLALCVTGIAFFKAMLVQEAVAFGDEAIASTFSKWGSGPAVAELLGTQAQPNHLYFFVFHSVHVFGTHSLQAAKALNALLFGVACLPLFWVAKKFVNTRSALYFAAVSSMGGAALYATFFMAESFYFLGFWCYVAVCFYTPQKWRAYACGVTLGLLAMIKPHAIVLLPACWAWAVTMAIVNSMNSAFNWQQRGMSILKQGLYWAGALALPFFVTKILWVWLLTGQFSAQITGDYYRHYFDASIDSAASLKRLQGYGLLLRGHISLIVLTYALPLTVMALRWRTLLQQWRGTILLAASPTTSRTVSFTASFTASFTHSASLCWFALFHLGALLVMTIKFTADISGTDEFEHALRIHERYYFFALPLLLLLTAKILETCPNMVEENFTQTVFKYAPAQPKSTRARFFGIVLGWMLIMALVWRVSSPFRGAMKYGYIDSPDFYWTTSPLLALALLCFALLAAGYGVCGNHTPFAKSPPQLPHHAVRNFYLIFLLSSFVMQVYCLQGLFMREPHTLAYDAIGKYMRAQLPQAEVAQGVLIMPKNNAEFTRVQFHLNAPARPLWLPEGAVIGAGEIGKAAWVIAIGDYTLSSICKAQDVSYSTSGKAGDKNVRAQWCPL